VSQEDSTHEELTRYLLGEMPEDEQTDFEMRYFSDGQLFGELCARRNQLIDSYVSGQLSPSMRERFEAGIDKSWAINERIRFAETLQGAIDTRSVGLPPAPRQRHVRMPAELSRFVSSYGRLIVVATILVTLLGVGWLIVRSRREPFDGNEAGLANRSTSSADKGANAPNQPRPNLNGSPAPLTLTNESHDSILTVPLTSDLSANAADVTADVLIPPNAIIVKLILIIENPQAADYSAVVTTSKDGEVFKSDNLKPDENDIGKSVNLFVPANRLPAGDYVIRLTGMTANNETMNGGNYHLRVQQR
jgi:hypothetical protein